MRERDLIVPSRQQAMYVEGGYLRRASGGIIGKVLSDHGTREASMTSHSYHEDSHTHGLHPGCPRCEEHAEHPEESLDRENVARLRRGELKTSLDSKAAVRLRERGDRIDEATGQGRR